MFVICSDIWQVDHVRIQAIQLRQYWYNMSLKEFQILQKLGVGSFGVVFKAIKKENGLTCVLKEVGLAQMDVISTEWAMNQAAIMKDIESKYIVQYYLSFVEKGKLYICMEYCSGGDLAQYLRAQKGKPLNQDLIWKFSLQIMLGMRTLHLRKVLHRDIKTMNIFLAENRQVKIGDLGVAKTMTGDFAKTVVGTPYYLSPEMCEEKPYNEKTDVWAMGCLVYQLCTGRHPFQASNQAALAMKIIVGKYPPLPANYSPLISWLVKLCLSIDHKRRPTVQYILSHPDILKKAKSVGIALEEVEVKQGQSKSKSFTDKSDNANISVKQQCVKVVAQSKQLSKKRSDYKQQQKNVFAAKEELKQVDRRQRSKSKAKDAKKQVKQGKVNVQQIRKDIPPKGNRVISQPNKKLQIMQKDNKKATVVQGPNQVEESKVIPKIQIFQATLTQKQQTKIKAAQEQCEKGRQMCLQQNVDDDELFRDFGITPEKIVSLNDKVEFKKIIPINWEGCIPAQQLAIVKKLPAIHNKECNKSTQETGAVEMKQLDDDWQIMPDQISDDNLPYRSSSQQSFQQEGSRESLLLDDLPSEIEEQGELVRTQKISMLQRKIIENEKRKKELLQLRTQREAQLLRKMERSQLQKIKLIINEGRDEEIQKIGGKQLLQYYKIFHYSIEMGRCEETIAKCKELITEMISQH